MADFVLVFLSLFFGALIGLLLGLLGGGGSLLAVPVLVYVIGENVHSATGTSLAVVCSSALLGAFLQSRRGNLRLKSGILLGFMSMLGAVPGVWANRLVAADILLVLFGLLMIVVAVVMLQSGASSIQKSNVPCELYTSKDWLKIMAIGLAVGILTGFFGVGGGFLVVPVLVLVGKFPMQQAVGTSLLVIFMTSFSGFVSNLAFGGLDFDTLLLFSIGAFVGVLVGTKLMNHVSGHMLNKLFGVLVIFVAIYLIYSNI